MAIRPEHLPFCFSVLAPSRPSRRPRGRQDLDRGLENPVPPGLRGTGDAARRGEARRLARREAEDLGRGGGREGGHRTFARKAVTLAVMAATMAASAI